MSYNAESEATNPISLLTPEEILVFSIKENADELHKSFAKALIPNPEGIYLRTELEPKIRPGMKVIGERSHKEYAYKDLGKADEGLRNESGDILIPEYAVLNKETMLSQTGFYSISAINLIKAAIDINLRRMCKYAIPFTNINNAVGKCLKPDYAHLLNEDAFNAFIETPLSQLDQFIKDDNWNIYLSRVKTTSLYIEKTVDYRIYEWTRMQYEESLRKSGEYD